MGERKVGERKRKYDGGGMHCINFSSFSIVIPFYVFVYLLFCVLLATFKCSSSKSTCWVRRIFNVYLDIYGGRAFR